MSDAASILIVDDEPEVRVSIVEYFAMNGYAVREAEGGPAMRQVLAEDRIDIVLLDVRMPGEDGFALCRELREGRPVGIIMLTGSADTVDKVVGLEMGADDYVSKPFELRELLARVKSLMRRLRAPDPPTARKPVEPGTARTELTDTVAIGDFSLNLATRQLHANDGQPVPLTSMEFDLLDAFVSRPNRVLSRDQLLEAAHNRDWEPYDRSIDVRITRLRKKVERDPSKPRLIRTVRGAGYMYCPEG